MSKKSIKTNSSINNSGFLIQQIDSAPLSTEDALKKMFLKYQNVYDVLISNTEEFLLLTTPQIIELLREVGFVSNEKEIREQMEALGHKWVLLTPPLFRLGIYWVFKKV